MREIIRPATASPLQIYMPSIQGAATSFAVEVSAAPVHSKDRDRRGYCRATAQSGWQPHRDAEHIQQAESRPDYCVGGPLRRAGRSITVALCGIRWFDRYSDDFAEEFRQAAGYIDRILILASLFASATQSREALKTKRRGAPVLVRPYSGCGGRSAHSRIREP